MTQQDHRRPGGLHRGQGLGGARLLQPGVSGGISLSLPDPLTLNSATLWRPGSTNVSAGEGCHHPIICSLSDLPGQGHWRPGGLPRGQGLGGARLLQPGVSGGIISLPDPMTLNQCDILETRLNKCLSRGGMSSSLHLLTY